MRERRFKNKKSGERRYLVDAAMGIDSHERISEDAVAQMLEESAQTCYRKGGEAVSILDKIDRYTDGLVFSVRMQEVVREVLSAVKAPKKDGKGNPYVELLNRHMTLMDAMRTASRREFLHAILC